MGGWDAVVLAGGRGRRLGGWDKATLDVAGRTSLDRVLDAVADAEQLIVVGPPRPTGRVITWCREEPPYGGPPAAVASALPHCRADTVVLLACDAPLLDRATVAQLLAARAGHDAAWLVDAAGHEQYLAGAYRRTVLGRVVGARSLRAAFAGLDVVQVPGTVPDLDDWQAVAAGRHEAGGPMLKEWTQTLARELGITVEVDGRLVLDVARDAAHGVARHAAPLTTFLVGYAAGQAGGDAQALADACAAAQRLAAAWSRTGEPGPGGDDRPVDDTSARG